MLGTSYRRPQIMSFCNEKMEALYYTLLVVFISNAAHGLTPIPPDRDNDGFFRPLRGNCGWIGS